MRELAKFSSALRAANLTVESGEGYHPFSPEAKDAWEGISSLARTMRSIDGDADDVNYLIRAAVLENQLTEGVESGPKLSLANTKIGSLEKVSCIPAVDCVFRDSSQYTRSTFIFLLGFPELVVSLEGDCDAKCSHFRAREGASKIELVTFTQEHQVIGFVV
jgi:hypothetical protein